VSGGCRHDGEAVERPLLDVEAKLDDSCTLPEAVPVLYGELGGTPGQSPGIIHVLLLIDPGVCCGS
jgi:hypothetical protein